MKNLFKILTFLLLVTSFVIARNNKINNANKSVISIKINQFYFEIGDDELDKKRSHKRRKVKRKPRRGRDNR